MTPSVSVILPAYNAADWVGEAVESVLDQEFTDFELIAVNDGSTDGTGDILEALSDSRMKVLHQNNRGLSATRDVARSHARGSVLSFIDSDDRWRPSKLRREMDIFNSEPSVGVVFSNFVRFHETDVYPEPQFAFYRGIENIPVRPSRDGSGSVVKERAFEHFITMGEFPAYHSALSYRTELAQDLSYLPVQKNAQGVITFLEDFPFVAQLFLRTNVAFISDPMMEMRRHDRNSTVLYEQLNIAKLNSMLSLSHLPMSPDQRSAFDERLTWCFILAGRQNIRTRSIIPGLRLYRHALQRGATLSVLKALLRTPIDFFRPYSRRSAEEDL
jgi:glycosyltransferase involved in cell wall biosynthesis